MKHIKKFELFESYYDSLSQKIAETAKRMGSDLAKNSVRINTKDAKSEDEYRALRAEALEKVKNGDKKAYGAMYDRNGSYQSFFIAAPAEGISALKKPITDYHLNVTYLEEPGAWCVIDVYASSQNGRSLYMEVDGGVLFQWNDYEKIAKGSLVDKKA